MNTSEPSASSSTGVRNSAEARDISSSSSRSPTRVNSALSSSVSSSRSRSSFMSQKNARNQQPQPPRPLNESTPIFNGPDFSSRGYQATEAPNALRQTNGENGNGASEVNTGTANINQGTQAPQPGSPVERQSWYGRFVDRFGSLELENKGSVARDHLALERTFLAWMRTSLAFASIGIAVTQLFRLNSATASTDMHGSDTSHDPPAIRPSLLSPSLLDSLSTVSPSSTSSRLRSVGKPLGSTFIGVAILILIVGFHRYFESQYWIVRGKFPASRGSVALTAFVAAALIIAALAVILAVSPGAIER